MVDKFETVCTAVVLERLFIIVQSSEADATAGAGRMKDCRGQCGWLFHQCTERRRRNARKVDCQLPESLTRLERYLRQRLNLRVRHQIVSSDMYTQS